MRNLPPTLLVLPPGRIALENGEICRSYLVVIEQQVRSPDQDQVVYTLVKHQEDLKIFFKDSKISTFLLPVNLG